MDKADHVFLRTFSALVLSAVVAYDQQARALGAEEIREITDAALAYLAHEQDLRGFVLVKGWAHSVAHTADLLARLAEHPGVGVSDLERMLDAISDKVLAPTPYPYVDREEFRLGKAVVSILRRDEVPADKVVAWLQKLAGPEPRHKAFVPGEDNVRYHNATALLTALHIMFTYQELPSSFEEGLLPTVHAALKSFMPWFV